MVIIFVLLIIGIQFLMAVLNIMTIGNISGKWKLTLVCILSLIGGIISLRIDGLSWPACVVHSTTLGGMQVFFHQVWKRFREEE